MLLDAQWEATSRSLPTRLLTLLTARAATQPEAPVLVTEARRWRYRELVEGIGALRDRLVACGVRAGDRVLIAADNRAETLIAFYAVTAIDAWAVLVNARLSPAEIAAIDAACMPRLVLHADRDEHAGTLHDPRFGRLAFSAIRAEAQPEAIDDVSAERIALMLYTSGSTGRPKGVMLSHRALLHQSALTAVERGFAADDRFYVVAPITHIFGLSSMVLAGIYAGASLELVPRFDPRALLDALVERRITRLFGAPPMFGALIAAADDAGITLRDRGVREVTAGGAMADARLRANVERVFGMRLGVGYACTEFTPIAGASSAHPATDGAIGRVWRANDVRIFSADDRELPAGELGEVRCRGASAMSGYYRDPAASAEVMKPGGWIATGDLGKFDASGELTLVGRLKELIIRSGFNVYPAEVEQALERHASIAQAAVVGRAVASNEEVIAFVRLHAGATLDDDGLMAHLRTQLAPYKLPARIIAVDAFPLAASGKVAKRELKERAAALPR